MSAVVLILIIEFGDSNLVSSIALANIKKIVTDHLPIIKDWKGKKYTVGYNKKKLEYGIILYGII